MSMAITGGVTSTLPEDEEIVEWQRSVRARVTALKCHVMASQGLTPDGDIIQPYSADTLLKMNSNATLLAGVDEDVINAYVSSAMKKVKEKDKKPDSPAELSPEDVRLSIVDNDETPLNDTTPLVTSSSNFCKMNGSADSSPKKDGVSDISLKLNTQSESQRSDCDNRSDIIGTASASSSPNKVSQSSSGSAFNEIIVEDLNDEISQEIITEKLKAEIERKDDEIQRLGNIRDQVENELQDLTANLFQVFHIFINSCNLNLIDM